jgi:small-conductance mechanosensitive channel
MFKSRLALGSLILFACLAAHGGLAAQQTAPAEVDEELITVPVELDGTVLFRVRGVSSLSAKERASGIRSRLVAVAADPSIQPDAIRIVEQEGITRIQAGDQPIMSVVEADARVEQVARTDLAQAHLFRIKQAISSYRADRTSGARRGAAVNAAAATLALVLAFVVGLWLWKVAYRVLGDRLKARIQPVGIQSFELMRAEQIREAVRTALVAVRTLVFLTLVLVYLGFVLGQFPSTRGLSRSMAAFALEPLELIGAGIVENIPSLIFLTVLFVVLRLVLRMIKLFFGAVERGGVNLSAFEPDWAQPTYKIVRIVVVAFGLIVAYPYIPGSQSDAFRGVSIFLGVLFSLGSSSAIANMIAGYMLIYRRAFKVGDRIKVGDSVGDVIATRLQVTHLRSVKNEELIVPNSQILASEVVNYSSLGRANGLILHTEVGIGYETSWRHVEAMLIEAANRTPDLGTEPRPYVLEKRLGDFAVTYELNVFCTNVQKMAALYAALHRNILDVFNENGVQIMTPAYEGDPPEPKIVPPAEWQASRAAGAVSGLGERDPSTRT